MAFEKITYEQFDVLGHEQVNAIQDELLRLDSSSTGLQGHINNQNNPHNVTADQVQVTENVVNAIKETGNWSVDGILTQIGSTLFGGDVPRIQTGSYKGTGTSGASNPNSLTFNFAPKMVIFTKQFSGSAYSGLSKIWDTSVLTTNYVSGNGPQHRDGTYGSVAKKSADGKTVWWYQDGDMNSMVDQINQSGFTYYWIAIG